MLFYACIEGWNSDLECFTAIPSLAGQVDSICALQMAGDFGSLISLFHQDIRRARMVHWYMPPLPIPASSSLN